MATPPPVSVRAVVNNMKELFGRVSEAMPQILMDTLEPTFVKSQTYCPFVTGALRESGYLEVRQEGKRTEIEMGYGRNDQPPYAIYVHEIPAQHEEPTRDKFLQAAIEEDMPDFASILAAKVREVAGT